MKKKIIKAINETYFKNFQDTEFTKVTADVSFEQLDYLVDLADNIDVELYNMCTDLFEVMYGTVENPTYLSYVAMQTESEKFALEHQFTINFKPTQACVKASQLLDNLSKESYYVGGCVRDACIGKAPKDVDFCTDTPMEELVNAFKANGWKCDEVGLQFLVLVVSCTNEQDEREEFEIANFRKDRDNAGGEKGTMADDAQRRDFTVNAGYVRINDNELFDPNESFIDDITSKTLKFVGKATDRLNEDPIRAMRFYRFLTRGFTPDKKSLQAVRTRMQDDSKRITQLQKVLQLPGVKEAVDADFEKSKSSKMAKTNAIDMSFDKLSADLLSIERMRLEIERMI